MYCEKRLLEEYDTRILNLIHDSMLLEIPADPKIVRAVGRYCYDTMISAPKMWFNIDVPFKADYEIGKNWSDLVVFDMSEAAELSNRQIVQDEDDPSKTISWDEWYGKEKESCFEAR